MTHMVMILEYQFHFKISEKMIFKLKQIEMYFGVAYTFLALRETVA